MDVPGLQIFDPELGVGAGPYDELLRPGDICACFGTDWPARAISWGTASLHPWPQGRLRLSPSHVALICTNTRRLESGLTLWFESTTLCRHPCLVRQTPIAGCQVHPPEVRIDDYVLGGGRVEVYRLVELDSLAAEESLLLSDILLTHFCRPRQRAPIGYDLGGALVSGVRSRLFRWLWSFGDLNQVFCSELIAGVLQRIGRMNRGNPAQYHPGRLLRELTRQGVYRFEHAIEALP